MMIGKESPNKVRLVWRNKKKFRYLDGSCYVQRIQVLRESRQIGMIQTNRYRTGLTVFAFVGNKQILADGSLGTWGNMMNFPNVAKAQSAIESLTN